MSRHWRLCAQLPERRDTLEQAIDLRFDLRNALTPLGEHERILDSLRDAEALAEALGDQQRLGWVCRLSAALFLGHRRTTDAPLRLASGLWPLLRSSGAFDLSRSPPSPPGYSLPSCLGDIGGRWNTSAEHRCCYQGAAALGALRPDRPGRRDLPSPYGLEPGRMGDFAEGAPAARSGAACRGGRITLIALLLAYMGWAFWRCAKEPSTQAIPMLERGLALCQTAGTRTVLLPGDRLYSGCSVCL